MKKFRNAAAVAFVVTFVIGLLIGLAPAANATTEHCPDKDNPSKVEVEPDFGPSVTIPAGHEFCVKAGTQASGVLVSDGNVYTVTWTNNGGNIPGISYYIDYGPPPCETDCEPECETDCGPVRQVDVNINCDKLVIDSTEEFSTVAVKYGDFDYEFDIDAPWFLWDFPRDDDHSIEVVTVVFGDGEEFEFVSQVDCDYEPEPEPSVTPTPEPSPTVVVDPPDAFKDVDKPDLTDRDGPITDSEPVVTPEPVVEGLPEAGVEGAAALFVLALCLLASGGWIVRKYGWMN